MDRNEIYRRIPGVDRLMQDGAVRKMTESYGYDQVLDAVRQVLDKIRKKLGEIQSDEEAAQELDHLPDQIEDILKGWSRYDLRRVINATGIILHTGLGRAPLGEKAAAHAMQITSGYSNLEYDLESGERGDRSAHFEKVICRITGFEAAMAVNNNAAAVFLTLAALAGGGDVIVSRGELVEIGGKFRVPEMMEVSRARLKEVGTTNRTHLSDYENAVGADTRAFLKVHTSNYRIVGFTSSVSLEELCGLREKYNIPVIEDLGSGVFVDLKEYGLPYEPTVQEAAAGGADVVTFSGDKLLGGPQAGIIAGKKEYIDRIRRHPLARVLRIDKFTAAALEAVLMEYLDPETAEADIPALRMLTCPLRYVKQDADTLAGMIRAVLREGEKKEENRLPDAGEADETVYETLVPITAGECRAAAGGGAMPGTEIRSYAVYFEPVQITPSELDRRMRRLEIPVIGRIQEGRYFLDMRTVDEREIPYIAEAFRGGSILKKG
ncbi:MAG TPA: L-seryl-tRNA(Sec) selenium transferase [Candidatus Mediterraneibacter stercoripullorum]|nr:L-seryl-tRNA(Sec) selenium transferase [Candidatus Mediterraneibacter stercoripullorum]